VIGFLWALLGAVFGAGVAWGAAKQKMAKQAADLNGIGRRMREDEGRAERRWKHMIATQIETSTTLDEAKEHAKLLREDAWRD
jgi:hypothetical protein